MAFLHPHFDPDVFVSYSHGDPRGAGGSTLKEWTQALIKRLEGEILALEDDFDPLHVWIDEQIDPTAHLTAELRDKVSASGILLIVLSKRYLGSSWCRDELDWFRQQIQDRAGDVGRVFVLRAQPTDTSAWPDFLRDERGLAMPGFTFFDPANGEPLGWPDLRATDRAFAQVMSRLRMALIKRLRELKERAETRARAEAVVRTAPIQPPLGKRRVYLHASTDAEPARADIAGMLSQDGIVPVRAPVDATAGIVARQEDPKADLAAWQEEGRRRREMMAKRCEALALLRADDGARFEADVWDIGVDERERIASERGASLPCAVLDRTGVAPPFDLRDWDIEHFDVTRDGWRGHFREWLDANRAGGAAAQT